MHTCVHKQTDKHTYIPFYQYNDVALNFSIQIKYRSFRVKFKQTNKLRKV